MMKGGTAQSLDWPRMMHGPGKDVLISGKSNTGQWAMDVISQVQRSHFWVEE